MRRTRILDRSVLLFLVFLVFSFALVGAKEAIGLVGAQVGDFSLPSSQDRLVRYNEDYYGKYHLVITFFPAAFTPT